MDRILKFQSIYQWDPEFEEHYKKLGLHAMDFGAWNNLKNNLLTSKMGK